MTNPGIQIIAGDAGYEAQISGDWTLPYASELEKQMIPPENLI